MKLILKFSATGMLVGCLVGMYEGLLLLFFQHSTPLVTPVAGVAILLYAPLVDAFVYCLLGAILGSIAKVSHRRLPRATRHMISFGVGAATLHITYLATHIFVHFRWLSQLTSAVIAIAAGSCAAVVSYRRAPRIGWNFVRGRDQTASTPRFKVRHGAIFAGAAFLGLVIFFVIMKLPYAPPLYHISGLARNLPNLVLIVIDTARADHLSAYGYPKPTSPNLDNLARKGILFERAVAPVSWTLPSFASVFTGLLPHQTRAGWESPLAAGTSTIASILDARGYQTAGFNANHAYGTARTGLAQGFEFYSDDDRTIRSDLLCIDAVKAFWWLVYYPFIWHRYFAERDARVLNKEVFNWYGRRTGQPYFLFVNYIDVHEPYSTIPEIGDRFGEAGTPLAQRIRAEVHGLMMGIEVGSPAEQRRLIAGYDSALAYTDSQIGNLLSLLESSPEWSNTYIIVMGDHGQGLGAHGRYGHGWGLGWELVHVPLIIVGPGIPNGARVKEPVALWQIFETLLDFSGGANDVSVPESLRCHWGVNAAACNSNPIVISELGVMPKWGIDAPSISVVTPRWHLIRDATDNLQLYDLTTDPLEERNLATSKDHQVDIADLQDRLFDRIETSALPWLGEDYLWALGKRQFSLLAARHLVHSWPSGGFKRPPANQPQRPDNELLHSLPYQ